MLSTETATSTLTDDRVCVDDGGQRCTIEVNDYSATRAGSARRDNDDFFKFLGDEGERGASGAREPWVRVRWIDVGGISWDVISAVALKYDLHPLALEDVLHQRAPPTPARADYHLFIRILVHTLASSAFSSFSDDRAPESTSPPDMFADDKEEADTQEESWRHRNNLSTVRAAGPEQRG
ncbi:hypothetical protein BD309DRAFT_1004386 [Dichomitus squalens]|uniref:Uncharacterized protein n=1 Tax=Dichomitus squalens TaxID=114155 RepID=A0A4V2K2X7_9APHY|nr:hypothetical protein BD309DRAFT_1004386 [Dichomitus squalens]TBU51706.1 hypothetical protein BD310DRAFT_962969 [Dichomitus squalens]